MQHFSRSSAALAVLNANLLKITAESRISIFYNGEIGFAETSAGKSCRNVVLNNRQSFEHLWVAPAATHIQALGLAQVSSNETFIKSAKINSNK